MHKNSTKCNETLSKWCKNKHGASKIIDTLETYHIHDPELIWINNQHWDLDIHDGSFAYMNNFHQLCLIQKLTPLLQDINNNPR
jgi:hypothetical protein